MDDTVQVLLEETEKGRVKMKFTFYSEWLSNNKEVIFDLLEYSFGIDYLAAQKITNDETTSIIIETEKGKVLTYLNTTKNTFINQETLKQMLGFCLIEGRDN